MKLRLLALGALFMAVYALAQWLLAHLGWTLLVAGLCWALVLLGLARTRGLLAGLGGIAGAMLDRLVDVRVPLTSAFAGGAPYVAPGAAMPSPASPAAGAAPRPDRDRVGEFGMRRIDVLRGLNGAKQQLNALLNVAGQARRNGDAGFGAVAPATLLLFYGPAGTGKSEAAAAFAQVLYGAGIIAEPNCVLLRSGDMADQSAGGAYAVAQQAAMAALDGVLLIENAEWITGGGDARFAAEVARGLMHVVTQHPQRLIFIAVGGPGLAAALDDNAVIDRELLARLHVEEVPFAALSGADLVAVFGDHARARRIELSREARARLPELIARLQREEGDRFGNALSVRRLFDRVYGRAQRRAGQGGGPAAQLLPEDLALERA